jgi:hypothetical protein
MLDRQWNDRAKAIRQTIVQLRDSLWLLPLLGAIGCSEMDSRPEKARAMTRRLADEFDSQTTKTGRYVRAKEGLVAQTDPWGSKLRVTYSSGGMAEELNVQSAGPDKEFDTDDDVVEQRMTANLAGIGEGVKENIGEVAKEAAAGAVQGTVDGIKDSVKANLPKFRKQNQQDAAGEEPAAQ